jgi:hypothetical protein
MSRTARMTPEQHAEVKARVASWPRLTEAQREHVRALFDGHDFTEIRSYCPASGQ